MDDREELIGGKRFDADAFYRSLEYVPPVQEKKITVISDAKEVERLTSHQENKLYAKAKLLKEQIRSSLLTMSQLNIASEDNVKRHMVTEGSPEHARKVEEFRNIMKVIGADEDDISIEKMRKE